MIVALLLGVFSGCMLLNGGNALLASARTFDSYFVDALADREHAGVVLFTLLLGGTIGLVQKAGGGLALATMLRGAMTSARSALASCMALCSLIFFDDYSSVLIVGNSMRTAVQVTRRSAPMHQSIDAAQWRCSCIAGAGYPED